MGKKTQYIYFMLKLIGSLFYMHVLEALILIVTDRLFV